MQKHSVFTAVTAETIFIPTNLCFGIGLGCSGGKNERTHPEIDAHGGDEAAGQKGGILETDQQAGLPHARVPNQHHLCGGEGTRLSLSTRKKNNQTL